MYQNLISNSINSKAPKRMQSANKLKATVKLT